MERAKKELNVQIGKRLREVRDNLGYTQSQFAEILGVGEEHYRKIELGSTALTIDKVWILHDRFKIDSTYLIVGEKKKNADIDYLLANCTRQERDMILHRMFEYTEKVIRGEA